MQKLEDDHDTGPLRNRSVAIIGALLAGVLTTVTITTLTLARKTPDPADAARPPSTGLAGAGAPTGAPALGAPRAGMPYDFDGDGRADLVTTTTTPPDTGGSRFTVTCCTTLHIKPSNAKNPTLSLRRDGQTLPVVPEAKDEDSGLAAALASADFDRDGYADLAIGTAPRVVNVPGGADAVPGDVLVVPGSAAGLDLRRTARLDQDTDGVPGKNDPGDRFGNALAAGDVTNDGYADLVVGVPGEGVEDQPEVSRGGAVSGSIVLFRGSRSGLDTEAVAYGAGWGTELGGSSLYSLGDALVTGSFDGTGAPDLAVLGRDEDGVSAVFIIPGSPDRGATPLDAAATRVVRWADDPELPPLRGDRLPLVAGDADGDRIDELATVSYLRTGSDPFEGAVAVIPGAPPGRKHTVTLLSQATEGMPGVAQGSEGLDMTVRFGDVNGDGRADLAVGFPMDRDEEDGAGAVLFLRGSADGLSGRDAILLRQGGRGVPGRSEAGDAFGSALSMTDRTGDGIGDLVVGASGETTSEGADEFGTLTLFTGSKGLGVPGSGAEAHGYTHFGFGPAGDGQVFGGRLP